jgi:nitroreductase
MTDFKILSNIIRKRRSIFPAMYIDKEIDDHVIDSILENANWAPTHRKTEPWRFRVIKGKKLHELSDFLGNFYKENTPDDSFSPIKYKKTLGKPLKSACVIAICMKRDPDESVPEWEEIAAVACAVQNMWLSCTSLEIGSYWSTPKSIHHMDQLLSLDDREKCLGLFYMGYQKKADYDANRGGLENKVKWL